MDPKAASLVLDPHACVLACPLGTHAVLPWLCAPVSTAGLERGFSFQTLIDQDTRRHGTTSEHMRDDMFVHIHREWFNMRVNAAL